MLMQATLRKLGDFVCRKDMEFEGWIVGKEKDFSAEDGTWEREMEGENEWLKVIINMYEMVMG